MPHIIVEYSKNLGDIVSISKLVYKLHETLAEQDGIEEERIKARALECKYVAVGERGSLGHMLHCTLLLLEGRDVETKRKYGDLLHGMLQDYVKQKVKHCAVTLEIRDLDKETYYL